MAAPNKEEVVVPVAEAEAPAAEPVDVVPEEENPWGELATELTEDDDAPLDSADAGQDEEEEPVEAPAEKIVPPVPEAPKAQAPQVAQAPVEAPKVAEPVAVPQQPQTPQPTPAEIKAKWEERRGTALTELEQAYALDEADGVALQTEPEKVLPKLAARVHMDVLEAVMNGVAQQFPYMMRGMLEQESASQQSERVFFEQWPQLQKPEHQGTIMRIAAAYRQINPNMPLEDMVREVGTAAMVTLRIPMEGVAAAPVSAPPAGGFAPASPGGASIPKAPKQLNEFQKLAEEFLHEEE